MNKNTYLKGAGVLLLTAVLLLSATAVTANTTNHQITIMSPTQYNHNTGTSRDTILYDNDIVDMSNVGSSQYATTGLISQIADDFTLNTTGTCGKVIWIGGYWSGTGGGFNWNLSFYNDDGSGTKPGTMIYDHVFLNAQTNETALGGFYWSYEVTLTTPLTFTAGAKYWLCVQGVGNNPPQCGWAMHTSPINGHMCVFQSAYFGYPNWVDSSTVFGSPYDACFQLLSGVPPLTCNAGGPYSGTAGSPISFTGNASGGTIPYTWAWTFGDGGTSTVQNPAHTYAAAGNYTATLTVTDAASQVATATAAVTVTAPVPHFSIVSIKGGFGISAVVKNIGIINATASWKIQLTGGLILLGKSKTGSATIAVGKTATVKDMVFGFGKTSIVVTAGDASKNATGTIILFFALGVK